MEPLTNEQIAQQLTEMRVANEKQITEIKALHEKQIADLKAVNDKQAQDNKTIQDQNKKLLSAISTAKTTEVVTAIKKEAAKLPTQRVKIGQAEYAFQVPVFYHNGYYYTAEEIVADQGSEAAQQIFVDLLKTDGQGILKLVK